MSGLPRLRRCCVPLALALASLPAHAWAAPWNPDPNRTLPGVADVTQKLELVDFDADGFVDLVFANSRGDSTGSDADAQLNHLIRNDQGLAFVPVAAFDEPDNAYVIKAGDIDRDGDPDLVVGVNFGGQSYLLLQEGGAFSRQDIAPGAGCSVGDLELGDVDGDGDLDVLAADWGGEQPFDDPLNTGGPVRLWLGDGLGEFVDGQAQLPMGVQNLVSWSFDVEFIDFDNDFDLDVVIASRGPGHALALVNDGAGNLGVHPVPPLQPPNGKQTNTAFTVIDLNVDDALDLVTLHDGPAGGNTVLIGDGAGNFTDNPGAYWALVDNPPRLDCDAATLDFNNDTAPDVVVVGPRQNPGEINSRLMLNDSASLDPMPPDGAAFPLLPELDHAFAALLADLDHDRRADAVVAVRDEAAANLVLFAGAEVPEDVLPPRIFVAAAVPESVTPLQQLQLLARVHDARIPARWHDFRYDPGLPTYNLAPGTTTAHLRRLPWLEYAIGLSDPEELALLSDDHPNKHIVPGEWYGEALWRVDFEVPVPPSWSDPLASRLCAIDAAGNRACTAITSSTFAGDPESTCGDGVVQPWEACDDALDPLCVDCTPTCGNGLCERHEGDEGCPEDCFCANDGYCDPVHEAFCCDCGHCGTCGDGTCQSRQESWWNCPDDCTCGNGVCEPPLENHLECPADCLCDDCDGPTTGQACGDGVCSGAETEDNCPADCGPVCWDGCDAGGDIGMDIVYDGPCGCRGAPGGGPLGLLLALLARRRRMSS